MRLKRGWYVGILLWAIALLGCGPSGNTPGWRLPGKEVSKSVTDWSFASEVREIAFETTAPWGWHSVTLWCGVVEGRLYVTTDSRRKDKRWVRQLGRNPDARVGINGLVYPVRARSVKEPALWRAVVEAYAQKYRDEIHKYNFPVADDLSSGRIFELNSRLR